MYHLLILHKTLSTIWQMANQMFCYKSLSIPRVLNLCLNPSRNYGINCFLPFCGRLMWCSLYSIVAINIHVYLIAFHSQDQIRFRLCDYRQLPETCKYDRIISWYVHHLFCIIHLYAYVCIIKLMENCSEMLEAVGHEYMEKFFSSCNSVLAEDGILVLQVIIG